MLFFWAKLNWGNASPTAEHLQAGRRKSVLYLKPIFKLQQTAIQINMPGQLRTGAASVSVCNSLHKLTSSLTNIKGLCFPGHIKQIWGIKEANRTCGSEVFMWAKTTSATFSGTIFFGLTGGRERFCSCSSLPCHVLPALPCSAAWQSLVWVWRNFCLSS